MRTSVRFLFTVFYPVKPESSSCPSDVKMNLKTVEAKSVRSGMYCMWHRFGDCRLFLHRTTDTSSSLTEESAGTDHQGHNWASLWKTTQRSLWLQTFATYLKCRVYWHTGSGSDNLALMWHAIARLISTKHTAHTHRVSIYTQLLCVTL